MEFENQVSDAVQNFADIKLEIGEEDENVIKVDNKLKRNSLSKFFRFKGSSDTEEVPANASVKTSKTSAMLSIFKKKEKEVVEVGTKEKTSTLTRLFSKKEKEETGSEVSPRRSFMMPRFVAPWISRKPSMVNLHQPSQMILKVPAVDGDEIATSSQIF